MAIDRTLLATAALLISAWPAAAAPPQPIGSAVTVVNLVRAAFEKDERDLKTGDPVHQDEDIEVAPDASGELKLDDETQLALGPGARMRLDKFVYDPDKSGGSIILDLVKGTFRFVTGVAAKPAYVIRTPAASITVRGTKFDVFIEEGGPTWLLLHEGAVRACNDRGVCREHDEPGKLIRISEDGDVGNPVRWASLEGKDSHPFDNAFPFVTKSPSFDPEPEFSRENIILGNFPDAGKPDKPEKTYDDDKPSKQKPSKETYKPKKEKPNKEAYKPKPTKKAEKKYPKRTKTARGGGDSAGTELLKTGIGIGIGIGLGSMGRGGRGGGGHKGGY